jgi:hypothetical protein
MGKIEVVVGLFGGRAGGARQCLTRLRRSQGAYESRTYRFRLSTRRWSSRRVKGGASSRDGGVVELLGDEGGATTRWQRRKKF